MGSRIMPARGLGLVLLLAGVAAAQPRPVPSDGLLRLVPPDAAVVVTVDNLRDHAAAFLKSSLAADLRQLPAVRDWFVSEKYQQFERSRADIEGHLGVNLAELRDQLLGDAVVLALRLPPGAPAEASPARGMLLVKVKDLALLRRVIGIINASQQESGELTAVVDRRRNGTTYHVREFPPAANRPDEWFVVYPDGTFAFSNSESMIQSVIDRHARPPDADDRSKAGARIAPGLGELPRVVAVQNQLPGPAVARLLVDPRHFERLLAAQPRPTNTNEARPIAILERFLAAVDYAGASLKWSDESIVIQTVETLNPSVLDPWLRHWAADVRPIDSSIARVPPSALAHATGHLDATAVLGLFSQLIGEEEQAKLANLEALVTGLLLGQDVRTQVLPRLGPGVLAYLDTPPEPDEPAGVAGPKLPNSVGWPFPPVVVVSLGADTEPGSAVTLAAAADNALRSALAATALDDKRHHGRSRITNRTVAGTTMTTLDPAIPFAYAIDRGRNRLVLSRSPEAVARYLESASDRRGPEPVFPLQTAAGAGIKTYASINLDALTHLAGKHRAGLLQALAVRQERPVDDVDRDLSQVLALARLFRIAFISSRIEPDATVVRQSIGLIRHAPDRK